MATLKYCIVKKDMRRDKTWRVQVRLTHERKTVMIPTSMYVSRSDLTSSYQIKNPAIIGQCEDLIREYKDRIEALDLALVDMDAYKIREEITKKDYVKNVEFFSFARKWISDDCRPKCRKKYLTAVNRFEGFIKVKHGHKTLPCNELSCLLMLQFEKYLRKEGIKSELYCQNIKTIFNEACIYYNDNPDGVVVIRRSLDLFKPRKDMGLTEKRALTTEQVRKIAALEDAKITTRHDPRRDLARDVFIISFLTMGTNTIDLMECVYDKDGNITYERAKVRDIRADRARIVIRPHPLLKPYLEKYAHPNAPDDRHVFSFCCRYKDHHSFSHVVNMGLKAVGEAIGIEGLNYYAARHSMATIALNEVLIDKLSVHEMLNHRMPKFRVTDMYIHRDFDRINRMNFRLIEHVFGKVLPAGENSGDRLLLSQALQPLEDGEIRFRYRINPDAPNLDRTWSVIIQVSVGAQSREIKSSIKVCQRDINTDYNIKNPTLIERCNDLLDKCRKKTAGIGGGSGVPDIDTVIRKLVSR